MIVKEFKKGSNLAAFLLRPDVIEWRRKMTEEFHNKVTPEGLEPVKKKRIKPKKND